MKKTHKTLLSCMAMLLLLMASSALVFAMGPNPGTPGKEHTIGPAITGTLILTHGSSYVAFIGGRCGKYLIPDVTFDFGSITANLASQSKQDLLDFKIFNAANQVPEVASCFENSNTPVWDVVIQAVLNYENNYDPALLNGTATANIVFLGVVSQ